MERLFKTIKHRYGVVDLLAEDGMTKIAVGGLRLSFPEAEKLALGKTSLEELKKNRCSGD